MLPSLLILLAFNLVGEALVRIIGVPVPGNVVGMVLLAVALRRGWIAFDTVRPASDVLLRNLALFFVPPGVGLMLFFDLLADEWVAIVVANVVGLMAVLVVVGLVQERLERPAPAGEERHA
jgi:holin-like protein